ncbi:MAG: glutamate racemase [Tannerella sp.]|jgi:glutamate racemase|nr:glutamate racemase [Tannerella sp.]
MIQNRPIGVFDSGYGGLTVLCRLRASMPQYDYVYFGDNARTPYGTRSFEIVRKLTDESVFALFNLNCPLVVLACNTASAKALRSFQEKELPNSCDPTRRVLGVIRPTVEALGSMTQSRHVGILGTVGTVTSRSYDLETAKLFPDITVVSEACPMWVPLVESNEYASDGADYFVRQHLNRLLTRDPLIDVIVLACTHYPLLEPKIRTFLPDGIKLLSQGDIVAASLKDYLLRHPEMEIRLTKNGLCNIFTSEDVKTFSNTASVFLSDDMKVQHLDI